jgi:hypothetical protein
MTEIDPSGLRFVIDGLLKQFWALVRRALAYWNELKKAEKYPMKLKCVPRQ